eukprot:TRINITY_DN21272_c0_g1_i1.p2 TRINITY_DN21272_c0_g1~~TRINITY_DN21272_c0_g1_i1.p2  ORF type:complete len:262 (+),score=89.62 TRINITY_DN21272_c0_g1_i1:49-834(+)
MSGLPRTDSMVAREVAEKEAEAAKQREEKDEEMARALHEKMAGTTATDFQCALCFDEFNGTTDLNKGVVTECGHKFCIVCFMKYVDSREKQIAEQMEKARNQKKVDKDIKCPLCRADVMKTANKMRRLFNAAPVYIPEHATPQPRQMTWDPAMSVVVQCDKCGQRLFAPPNRDVKCVCKHIIKQQRGHDIWRKDSQVITASTLPQDQQKLTMVICPGCRGTFSARTGETIRCTCGTGLFVPPKQQTGGQPNNGRPQAASSR